MNQRPYQSGADFPAVIDLLIAARQAGIAEFEFSSITLRLTLNSPEFDTGRHTWLVIGEDGAVRAFAILWRGRYLGTLIHPEARGAHERELIAWGVGRVHDDRGGMIGALARDDDTLTRGALESQGFVLDEQELRMARSLDLAIPATGEPAGFEIRPLEGEADLPGWIAVYEEAFGAGRTAARRRAAWLRDGDYDPELDLVAVDEHGQVAGFCACSIASAEFARCTPREGHTGPIAVRAAERGRGIGTALVLKGLRRLRERGVQVAMLDTDADNVAAQRLYERLGYRTQWRACWYTRSV